MERATSITAALQAGKLPSTEQLSVGIDNLLKSDLLQVESVAGSPQLTKHGKIIAADVREILSAYKALGEATNADNLLQETIWHFSQADITGASLDANTGAANKDAKHVGRSLLKALEIVWSNAAFEGTNLFADFASFSRLTLADAAELVESGAANAKTALRQIESEVQDGDRTAVGTKRQRDAKDEGDARVKFEKTMDSIKDVGSQAIGAGQTATAKVEETSKNTANRLSDAYYKICQRAQTDPEYRDAVSTVLDLIQKWIDKTLDTAADVNQNTDIHSFVEDPTEEKHLHKALTGLRALAERGSGDKSLDDLFKHVRSCAADIRSDPDTKAWFETFFEHARKSLEEPDYGRSAEALNKGEWLRVRWEELRDADSDVGRKWKSDVEALEKEVEAFQARVSDTPSLTRLRQAHAKFAADLAEATAVGAASGISSAVTQSIWVYQDFVNVYLPRVLGFTKGMPIPRTEYKDASTEFVLEDLDISTLAITPGNLYIRNITDIDITANAEGETDTSVGAMTHIHAKGVQLELREVSFYYHDLTATLGPSEVTGIMELTMPPEGLEIDLKVRLLPNTETGLAERERIKGYHKIENVEVEVSDKVTLNIKDSNHGILLSLFKPAMLAGFRKALSMTLSEQLRTALEFADGVAFDISKRSVVFEDMGLTRGPALAGAIWSEVGRFMRAGARSSRAGLTEGWQLTGTGVIKHGNESSIAMGAEPQILSGDKHGPKATLAEPIGNKVQRAADEVGMDVDVEGAAANAQETAASVTEQAADLVQKGVKKVRGFKQAIDNKREEELKSEGWRSSAFDA